MFDAMASQDASAPDAGNSDAPDPPSGFSAIWNAPNLTIELAWTNPQSTDLAGALIIKSPDGPLVDVPTDGTNYAAGDVLPNGGLVVHAGLASALTDSNLASGTNLYGAWSFDETSNYSTAHAEASVTGVPTLRISTIDLGNPSATVVGHPWPLQIDATASLKPAMALIAPATDIEMQFTATAVGAAGNAATITLTDGGDGSALTVEVAATAITVTYDRFVHSATEIAQLINNDTAAAAVMTAHAPVAGVTVESVGPVALAGGSDTDLRVHLRATNNGARPLFNAKMLVSSNGGTAASRYSINGQALAYFGYTGLDVGASASGWFDITDFQAASSPISVELEVQHDPMVMISGGFGTAFRALDSSGSGAEVEISSEGYGYQSRDSDSKLRDGFILPSGRTTYLGNQNMPTVIGVDMMTLRPTLSVNLDDGSGLGHINSVVPSPDFSTMYALVTYGAHAAAARPPGIDGSKICSSGTCLSTAEKVDLVKLRVSDLMELGRVTLVSNSANGARARKLSVSANGEVGAVALYREGTVAIVDLSAMTITRSVDVSAVGLLPKEIAIAPSGDKTYVAFKDYNFSEGSFITHEISDGTLQVIDHATWSVTPLAPATVAVGARPSFLQFGPDGKLYYGRKNLPTGDRLSIYDPTTMAWSTFSPPMVRPQGLTFSADGSLAYVFENDDVHIVDTASQTRVLQLSSQFDGWGHTTIVTDF